MRIILSPRPTVRGTSLTPWLALAVILPIVVAAMFHSRLAEPAHVLVLIPLLWACMVATPANLVAMILAASMLRVWLEYLHQSYMGLPIKPGPFLISAMTPVALYVVLGATAMLYRRRQEHLRRQVAARERLELIGQLAGGLAHDFNNVLTVVLGQVYTLRHDPSAGPQVRDGLDQIENAARRGAGLIRQLMGIRETDEPDEGPVNLEQFVHEAALYARPVLTSLVDMHVTAGPQPLPVALGRAGLHQLVLNLCINARDAMPGGGVLELELQPASVGAEQAARNRVAPGEYAVLTFTDTGQGMSARTLSRLFTPFFTTKPPEQGTGLGLVVVGDIVRQAGGFIDVQSKMGVGTTFRVYLPLAKPPVASQTPTTAN